MPKTHIPFFLKGKVILPEGQVKSSRFSHLHWDRGAGMKWFLTSLPPDSYPPGSTPLPPARCPSPSHSPHPSSLPPGFTGCQHNQSHGKHFLHQTGFPSSRTLHNLCLPSLIRLLPGATRHPLSALLALDLWTNWDSHNSAFGLTKGGKRGGMGEEVKI